MYVLIMHMPQDNAFTRALNEGWDETNAQLYDLTQSVRELGLGIINSQPFIKHPVKLGDLRPALLPPARRNRSQRRQLSEEEQRQRVQEREELMAIATGA